MLPQERSAVARRVVSRFLRTYSVLFGMLALIAACGSRTGSLGEGAGGFAGSIDGQSGGSGANHAGGSTGISGGGPGGTGGAATGGWGAGGSLETGGSWGTGGYGQTGGYADTGGAFGTGGYGTGGYPQTGGYAQTGGYPQTGGQGDGGGPVDFTLPFGSYDIQLDHVQVTPDPVFGPPAPPTSSPSEGYYLRLDYQNYYGYAAIAMVTPRWGDPVQFSVRRDGNALVLEGYADIAGPTAPASVLDTWTKFRLTPSNSSSGGALVQATGSEVINQGDTSWGANLRANGELHLDALAPEVRAESFSAVGPSDSLLPWDALGLRAAEGVNGLDSAVLATVGGPDGAEVSMSWSDDLGLEQESVTGMIHVRGTTTTWDLLPGASVLLTIPAKAISDPAGHPLVATFSTTVKYLNVGQPITSYTFDGAAPLLPGGWGTLTYYGQETGSDPLCGAGGCVKLGPFDNGDCVGRVGIAGRLRARSRYLTIRYRVLSADMLGGVDANGDTPTPFTLQTVSYGNETNDNGIPLPDLHELGSGAGELHYASDDITERFEAPVDIGDEFGFMIFAGDSGRLDCSGPPIFKGARTAVVIDRVGF